MSFKILSPLEQTHCDSMPWNKYRSKGINLQNASTFMRLQEWEPMNNFQHAFPWMTNSGEASTHLEETLQCCNLQSFLPGTSSTTDNSCIGRDSMAELYILLHWRNMSVQVHKVREDILRPTLFGPLGVRVITLMFLLPLYWIPIEDHIQYLVWSKAAK